MFLVMGITGNVGGATAKHLLAHGKEVRALVRNREKASSWANQGVELVDGDWNDSAAIEQALKGVEGAFVMLPAVWAPAPDYKEAKGGIANYVEALTKAAPPRVVALSSMGANRTSGLGMITALSLLEQGFRDLTSPIALTWPRLKTDHERMRCAESRLNELQRMQLWGRYRRFNLMTARKSAIGAIRSASRVGLRPRRRANRSSGNRTSARDFCTR